MYTHRFGSSGSAFLRNPAGQRYLISPPTHTPHVSGGGGTATTYLADSNYTRPPEEIFPCSYFVGEFPASTEPSLLGQGLVVATIATIVLMVFFVMFQLIVYLMLAALEVLLTLKDRRRLLKQKRSWIPGHSQAFTSDMLQHFCLAIGLL